MNEEKTCKSCIHYEKCLEVFRSVKEEGFFESTTEEEYFNESVGDCGFYADNTIYRKASEVARETVEAIRNEVSKKEQYISDLYGYGGFMIATTDLENIIRRYIFDTYEEAELKKKYTEEGK